MAEESQGELPPLCSFKDVEITVWNRVLERLAVMSKEGVTTITDEDYCRMWKEEVRKIVGQIQQRDSMNREKFRRWMGITE